MHFTNALIQSAFTQKKMLFSTSGQMGQTEPLGCN